MRFHMHVWTDHYSFLAVAQAVSVDAARKIVLQEIGPASDGSGTERDKAREHVINNTPAIWFGPNAEFVLTDSAELREANAEIEKLIALPKRTEEELATAMEFGYIQCEKGNNIQQARNSFAIVLNGIGIKADGV